jgi:hypothetical protein
MRSAHPTYSARRRRPSAVLPRWSSTAQQALAEDGISGNIDSGPGHGERTIHRLVQLRGLDLRID